MLDDPHRLGAVAGFEDAEAVLGEDRALGGARRLVVVDDEDRTGPARAGHAVLDSTRRTEPPHGRFREPRDLPGVLRVMGVRLLLIVALAATACGGLAGASPTPAPSPLTTAELKYRVMDAGGRIEFCDPDSYPIARADEADLARARIGDIQRDTETYAAITGRVGAETLAVYREWKSLNALTLSLLSTGGPSSPQRWSFTYRSIGTSRTPTPAPKQNGIRVEGSVDTYGKVDIAKRSDAGPLNCPICLSRGTRIATPAGEVAVEALRVGDLVWTVGARGDRVAAPLVAVGSMPVPPTHEVVRLLLDDGRVVLVSPGHPTADGRRVGDLVAGEALDGSRIEFVERLPYDGGATFDILPAGATGFYWAGGVLLGSTLR